MTGAELLIAELQRREVSCLYTLCGNGLDPILAACHQAGLRVIDTRNEQAAAYMADAAGRLTRKVGVCAVSSGVAHINALTGVCNAWFDGAPMLLITGATDSATQGRGHFQDMDTVGLSKPLVKFADWVDRPERIPWAVQQAFGAAVSGRPGPVHLTVPMDVLKAQAPLPSLLAQPTFASAPPFGSVPCRTETGAAVEQLAEAQRPVIIAGSGAFYSGAHQELARLAKELKAPVMVPIWDRGAVEKPIEEFVGVIGAASGGPSILPEADVVLLVGARVDYRVGYVEPPAVSPQAMVIRCEADANEMTQGIQPDIPLLGAPRSTLELLTQGLRAETRRADAGAWLAEAKRRDREFRAQWIEAPAPAAPPMTGRHIIDAMRQVVTDDTYLLVDGGNIGQWFHMAMCDRYPGRWMTCGASAVVGWGIPSAAAVRSVVGPEKPILLLSGDGAATFTIAELEAAARQCLPYVCIVADDSAWGIVVSGCRKRGATPVACELGPVDFAKVAEGFGAIGVRIDDPRKLPGVIEEGFAADRPTLIHCPIVVGGPAD